MKWNIDKNYSGPRNNTYKLSVLIICVLVLSCPPKIQAAKLNKREFRKNFEGKGIVLLTANWGRRWACGQWDNAQLYELIFEQTPLTETEKNEYQEIRLKTSSRLLASREFKPHGFIVNPGLYAFTGFNIKVSHSMSSVGGIEAGREHLVEDGKYPGGTFNVSAGEVIYIGDFYIDCHSEPIPWRFYSPPGESQEYLYNGFKSKFKYINDEEIKFRLLDDSAFGNPVMFDLNMAGYAAIEEKRFKDAAEQFSLLLEIAEMKADQNHIAFALYGLGQSNGYLCNRDSAIEWFRKSIEVRQNIEDAPGGYISQNYLELARLYFANADWANSVANFSIGVELLVNLEMIKEDPLGFANVLETYQQALEHNGDTAESEKLRSRISTIREEHQGEEEKYRNKPYPTDCGAN